MLTRRVAARIPGAGEKRTLLGYLSERFDYHAPEAWAQRIANGEIALDGAVCRSPEALLRAGMLLEYFPQNLVEPPVRRDYRILREEKDFWVIDKPGNLPVHPAGPYFAHTLWALLHEAGYPDVHFVNRLDRETSGVMLAARTSEAAKRLNAQLGSMRKTYLVLVYGAITEAFEVAGYLIADAGSSVRKKRKFVQSVVIPPEGEAAATHFTPLAGEGGITLLRAEPRTGRFHQIRATLFSLGYPVVGDKLYGLTEEFFHRQKNGILTAEDRAKLILPRQALHCTRLEFQNPENGEPVIAESPLPEEITEIFPWAAEKVK